MFNASRSAGPIASTGNVQTNLGVDTLVGETNSIASVWLRERANVSGNLTTAGTVTRQNGTSVLGAVKPGGGDAGRDDGADAAVRAQHHQRSVVGAQRAAGPRALSHDHAIRGGGITLKGGVYKVDHFIVDPRQGVIVDGNIGPVIVLVTSTFNFQGFATAAGASGGFPNWVVGYSGTADLYIGSQLTGTFFAPNGKVNMSIGNAIHKGTVVARNIELHQGGQFTHHPDPDGVALFRKLFQLPGIDIGDCRFAVPTIGIGRNGRVPNDQTMRVLGMAGFNPLHELGSDWDAQ